MFSLFFFFVQVIGGYTTNVYDGGKMLGVFSFYIGIWVRRKLFSEILDIRQLIEFTVQHNRFSAAFQIYMIQIYTQTSLNS